MKKGIYEKTISSKIATLLNNLSEDLLHEEKKIDTAELPTKLSRYVHDSVLKCFDRLKSIDEVTKEKRQLMLANELFEVMAKYSNDSDFIDEKISETSAPKELTAIKSNSVFKKHLIRPITSLAESTLFTGSSNEPSLGSEIAKEILSANEIDILMSFIRWSGLVLIYDELKQFTENGGHLRVITTSYMGATDYKAVEMLSKLANTEIKVSYDTKRTRLHAKAYIFKRDTGFSTAYIGSSNISRSAMEKGLEWNTKVTLTDFPSVYNQCVGRFETYWHQSDFIEFRHDDEQKTDMLKKALQSENRNHDAYTLPLNIDVRPYNYQIEILESLESERELYNNYRNLIVAATGTGKTIISGFDYKNFCNKNPKSKNNLLFIAHRQEILRQSLTTYRVILKDQNFGDLCYSGETPSRTNHLFISIQSSNSKDIYSALASDYYDYIVIDEFHHAGANSYKKVLEHFNPKILLGLTATPERTDNKEKEIIDTYFKGKFSAEIRLPEAIDRKLLTPFQYFGLTDTVDYSQIPWRSGKYDQKILEELLMTEKQNRNTNILQNIQTYITDTNEMRALAFCVSQKHADHMANFFDNAGIPSLALHSSINNLSELRKESVKKLKLGEIKILCVVDIFNEGVDLPFIDTVLFLRPTESLTIFLQQLGRGLRVCDNKEVLTVLDFVGQAHKSFSFENRFQALIGSTGKSVENQVKNDFPNLPAGCAIKLERKAKEYILNNIKQYFKDGGTKFVNRIKTFENDSGRELTLENFVSFYNLKLASIYKSRTWSELCAKAGVLKEFNDADQKILTTGLRRIIHINSFKYLNFLLNNWNNLSTINNEELSSEEQQFIKMFYYSIWQKPLQDYGFTSIQHAFERFFSNINLASEAKAILEYNRKHIHFIEKDADLPYPLALDVHCVYTRDEIMAAFGFYELDKRPSHREGVKHFKELNTDVFFITLDKSEKDYSPSTMYHDYAISDRLFHWQSQSTTPANSKTGERYIMHKELNHNILLFVREHRNIDGITAPFHFLGKCEYIKHEGSKPINITWQLEEEMPAYLVKKSLRLA